ncbi:MAG: OmpA family protein [Bacteroidales bacterium]|nr:OmpA family protein [Bacteroidales bacterium]
MKKFNVDISHLFSTALPVILVFFFGTCQTISQDTICPEINSKRALNLLEKAEKAFRERDLGNTIRYLNDALDIEPSFAEAHYLLGLIYISERKMNLKAAKGHFEDAAGICPGLNAYMYFHLARIYYGEEDFPNALRNINIFLQDVDRITSDQDYFDAVKIQEQAGFFTEMLSNPVPFDPKPVEGISTVDDEYLAIISPDDQMALFTRRSQIPPSKNDLVPRVTYKEKFMFALQENDRFGEGREMPYPFNRNENEGGATITIDNKRIFYTLCRYEKGGAYYNCDICSSEKIDGVWEEIENLGHPVNLPESWESQPTVTSDGSTLYFISDRPEGTGGYDIYKTVLIGDSIWGYPENLGPQINTAGNEKSPFIHTDSQTLYFSTDGRTGMGGYDIFYSRLNKDSSWTEPVNLGYPINSIYDDVGLFVSTDGKYAYFASNKFDGVGGWDLYSFSLYKEAQPERMLVVKGTISNVENGDLKEARIELKNVETKEVHEIPVDSVSGDYATAVAFRNDYIMTVKKRGYAYKSKYISTRDPYIKASSDIDLGIEPIKVGRSYRLNDIYFDFNSFELNQEAMVVIDEFFRFLDENPTLTVSIQGHTDNIGSEDDNLRLSENRARSVYNHLIRMGIASERLDYKGFGESVPISSNDLEEGRALNRRTEFVIITK